MGHRGGHRQLAAKGMGLARLLLATLLLLGTLSWISGCDQRPKEPVRVLAAQSLIDAFTAMETAFERAHPGVHVELSTASSGQLRAQIEAGAPADVFASASQHHMDLLVEQSLIVTDSRHDFAGNRMVLIAPTGSGITALSELGGVAIQHVAIGDWEHVPAGRYAREVLERRGILKSLTPKLRRCQHVRQVLTYVAAGEVEAGFVFRTDAQREPERVKVVWTAPPGDHTAIRLPIAALAKGERADDARRFVAFVMSPPGQTILSDHGFVVPPPEDEAAAKAAGSAP